MLRHTARQVSGLEGRLIALADRELVWWAVLAGAVVLRLRQYAAYLSFGNDEAALARNIVERSFGGLMQPLDYRQGAPVLFLFIQKAAVLAFGNKDFVLELFPLFAGLLTMYLMVRVAHRRIGPAGLVAVFASAISLWLIYFSANPKQYSSDAMVAVLLLFLADGCLVDAPHMGNFLVLGVAGAAAVWLSHPAAMILAGIGLVLVVEQVRRKDWVRLGWMAAAGVLWAAAFGALYMISLRSLAANEYLLSYWRAGFMPMPPWSNPGWFAGSYKSLMEISLGRADTLAALAWLPFLCIGIVSLLWRQRAFAAILLLSFLTTLAASAAHMYPFQQRLITFLVPFVYLLVAEGLKTVYSWIARWNRVLALAACVLLFAFLMRPLAVSAKRNFVSPPRPYDMRPVVQYLLANLQSGDTVFVSGGGETYSYYAAAYGLHPAHTMINNSHRIVRYFTYRRKLAGFAGRERVWIVFAHFEDDSHQYERYIKYLHRVGEIQKTFQTGYARVNLTKFDP